MSTTDESAEVTNGNRENSSRRLNRPRVVVRSVKGRGVIDAVREVLDGLEWRQIVPPGAKVALKLNLCDPDPVKAVAADTSPALVEAVCSVLLERTRNISLVEADSYRYPAEDAFRNVGIYQLGEKLGLPVVNLTKAPCREVGNEIIGLLPEVILDADVFVTLPVLKTHCLTYFTGSLKNQWGCVPRFDRISLHYALDGLIVDLQRILRPKLCIMDGIIGVDGRGPTNGRPRPLDLVLGSRDAIALDASAMRLVGLQPSLCKHVVMAAKEGLGEWEEDKIEVDMNTIRDWANFEPAKLDWAVDWMNRLTRYKFFRERILGVNAIFYPTKKLVGVLREFGIVR